MTSVTSVGYCITMVPLVELHQQIEAYAYHVDTRLKALCYRSSSIFNQPMQLKVMIIKTNVKNELCW